MNGNQVDFRIFAAFAFAEVHDALSLFARAVHGIDELHRLLFHVDDEAIDQRAEMAVKHQGGIAIARPKPVL